MMTAWSKSEDELYEFAETTAKEWYALKIVDDRQYLALVMLLHEMEKRTYYEWRRDDADN